MHEASARGVEGSCLGMYIVRDGGCWGSVNVLIEQAAALLPCQNDDGGGAASLMSEHLIEEAFSHDWQIYLISGRYCMMLRNSMKFFFSMTSSRRLHRKELDKQEMTMQETECVHTPNLDTQQTRRKASNLAVRYHHSTSP